MKWLAWVLGPVSALGLGCGNGHAPSGSGTDPPPPPPPPHLDAPVVKGGFAFYGAAQGLSNDVWDASPDEAGNAYVVAGDALFAKRRGDVDFKRFDAATLGITKNCDQAKTRACPLVSVAGAAPGLAYVGLKGIGTDGDSDPDWQLDSGGLDVLAYDGNAVTKTRHVEVAGVPHQMCQDHSDPAVTGKPCAGDDATWNQGRRKVRQVLRMAVNHDKSRIQYGDVWIAGTHGTFSLLVANADRRGWVDLTKSFPGTEDRRFVWEHDHPAISAMATIHGVLTDAFLSGDSTAIAIDPTTGDPWASNECRTATKRGYGAGPSNWWAEMWPGQTGPTSADRHMDIWPDPTPTPGYDAMDPRWLDAVSSLSFCDDGTLWIASSLHGIVRRGADGSMTFIDLPPGTGNDASAIACDPSNGSVWVGFGWGGFGRWDGGWWIMTPPQAGLPFATTGPVRSIQIDRWASPRIVYLAHAATQKVPGGLTVYTGR